MIHVKGVNRMEIGIGNLQSNNIEQNVAKIGGEIKIQKPEESLIVGQQHNIANSSMQERLIIKTIEKANKKFTGDTKELNFSIHEKTRQIMVKIVDKQSKEVIKEIPPEKILDMVASMCESAGLFIDEKK
jgi:flagellar protein FlaG